MAEINEQAKKAYAYDVSRRAVMKVKTFIKSTKEEEQDFIIKMMKEKFPERFGNIEIEKLTPKDRLDIFLVLALDIHGDKNPNLKKYYEEVIEEVIIEKDIPTGGGKVNGKA